ncbi:hypothetical protein ASD15_07545 [Massilia sp. Root351]|jgi:hypothetical protein|uniref:DUF29 domain-containing protein n=1 Tax=Massilia sp. Root351 TaxID=1736522 RepID=UPI00070A9CF4|nr:DUF29 domain-containing protein [Massilia sp. Root351]KQV84979.1 hypothetical protein ASD15_07545 [Massilia sp. Root351]
MGTLYDQDIAAWAQEQAALLRDRQWDLLDVEHIAEEIAELNLRERHELAHRYIILISHLLRWRYQPDRRCSSWRNTTRHQRSRIERLLARAPSLKHVMDDAAWRADAWEDAVDKTVHEANLDDAILQAAKAWTFEQIRTPEFFPE